MEQSPEILVAGNVNLETHLHIPGFPLEYEKFRAADFQITDTIAGVALNVAAALSCLGHPTALAGLVGEDAPAVFLEQELARFKLSPALLKKQLRGTARSVILSGPDGSSAIFSDLKDLQEAVYSLAVLEPILDDIKCLYMGNVNWALPLGEAARARGKKVATDVHHIHSLDDTYNARFLSVADIVFLSGEKLHEDIDILVRRLWNEFDVEVVVCGRGSDGAVLGDRQAGSIDHLPSVPVAKIESTVGAGDALAGTFLSGLLRGLDPHAALERAQKYAAHLLRFSGATEGWLHLELFEGDVV